MTLLIIIAVIVLIGLCVISLQRGLVSKDEKCKNALSQIGVQQASRWDALTALVELVKSYNEHEYNSLKDIIAMRKSINGNSSASDVQTQENALAGLTKSINIVAEN